MNIKKTDNLVMTSTGLIIAKMVVLLMEQFNFFSV